jgi:hypothetical protein
MLALLVGGCASVWQASPSVLQSQHWSLNVPDGWMRFTTPTYDMLSKDGPYLQYLFVQERPFSQPLGHTKRKLDSSLLPHEAAEIIVDNLKSDPQIRRFTLLSSEPAEVDGKMGFRLEYSHLDQQGAEIQSIYYGVILTRTFFNLRYTAARRYYFQKYLDEFEQMRRSLRLSAD